jgi:exonuclease SbcD
LGTALHGEERTDEQRQFLLWLLRAVEDEAADALVVAGDVFDVYAPPASAQKLYYDFLAGLVRLKEPPAVFIVAGNHDSPHFLGAPSGILDALDIHVIGGVDAERPQALVFEVKGRTGGTIVVGAVPFLRERDVSNLLGVTAEDAQTGPDDGSRYNRAAAAFYCRVFEAAQARGAEAGCAGVLLTGHLYIEGSAKSDDYSERTREIGNLTGLPASMLPPAAYYALGHLHRPQTLNGNMRYSGSPMAMSFGEAGSAKSVAVLEFDGSGKTPPVRLLEVPVWQELRQISGTPDARLEELGRLKAEERKAWVDVRVTEHEGELLSFWNTLDSEAASAPYKILVRQDARERGGTDDWRGAAESDLSSLEPPDVFADFLKEEGVDGDEAAVYMAMFGEVYNEAAVGGSDY